MDKAVLIARILLGLIFTVFSLNYFFGFFEVPPPESEGAKTLMGALIGSGYLMTLVKITELVCGVLLLIGRFVPLALTVSAPVIINIFFFHAFLAPDPQGMGMSILLVVLAIFLAWAYRDSFASMLEASAQPAT